MDHSEALFTGLTIHLIFVSLETNEAQGGMELTM